MADKADSKMLSATQMKDETAWLQSVCPNKECPADSSECHRIVRTLGASPRQGWASVEGSQLAAVGRAEPELHALHWAALQAAAQVGLHPDGRARLIAAGVVPALLSHMSAWATVTHRAAAAVALNNLCADVRNAELVARLGAVPPLLELVYTSTELLMNRAASPLRNLAFASSVVPSLVDAGALPALVKLLQPEHREAWEAALAATLRCTLHPPARGLLGQADAVPPLVKIAQEGSPKEQALAASVLQNIALVAGNKPRLIEAGAVPLLLQLLGSECVPAQEAAAGTVLNLTTDAEHQKILGEAGAATALLSALQSDSEMVQKHATAAALNLSQHPANWLPLATIAPTLLERSRKSQTEAAQNNATLALWNLVKERTTPLLVEEMNKAATQETGLGIQAPSCADLCKDVKQWMTKAGSMCSSLLQRGAKACAYLSNDSVNRREKLKLKKGYVHVENKEPSPVYLPADL